MKSPLGHKVRGSSLLGAAAIALLASTALAPARAADAASLLAAGALSRGVSGSGSPTAFSPLISPALQAQNALSAANLARAAKDIANLTAAQAAASASSQLTLGNAALSASSWNGTALSGLAPRDSDPTLWINADRLQKDTASATATVKQTAANALLTWQSFDLNKGEKLVFDQQGNADWTVLNRVVAGPRGADGSRFVASPSMILGTIEAPGSVYVINPNGVIFGPTAQINVHSLIASSLDVGAPTMSIAERNSFFLNTGILGNGGAVPAESFSYNQNDQAVEGDVVVQAGAKITASLAPRSVSPDAGGFVYLFAPNVENRGTISTPAGETMMVAAQAVQLIANAYPDGATSDANVVSSTFRAVGVNTTLINQQLIDGPAITDSPILWRQDGAGQITQPGKVSNTGLIDAERGVVILNGDIVANGSAAPGGAGGVIRANTSITRNGQIFLDARLQLSLSGGSLQILPSENGETIPESALSNFKPGLVEMRGRTVEIGSGTLIEAPGATVEVSTAFIGNRGAYPDAVVATFGDITPRLYMASDSVIDVSGLLDVAQPMSDNFLTFKPFGNEFADQPLQRDSALRGLSLTVDLRQTGTLNGTSWVGTPLANLTAYATSVSRNIDQLLTNGGTVNLASGNGDIVLRQGSTINVGGGSVKYASAALSESRLITSDGRIVSISRADPLDNYAGVAGIFELEHPHWGADTTETFVGPLLAGDLIQPGYTEGHDAGAINLSALNYVINGDFYGSVISGERQRAQGQRPTANDGVLAMPNAGTFIISGTNNLVLSAAVTPLAGNFTVQSRLSDEVLETTRLSAKTLTDGGFGKISANFSGNLQLTRDASLSAAPGGEIDLLGGSVDIEGAVTARSGTIRIESTTHIAGDTLNASSTQYAPKLPTRPDIFNLTLGSAALLDVSGIWVNDSDATPDRLIGGAFIDGGAISLRTDARSQACLTPACTTLPGLKTDAFVDLTGDLVLAEGARLDASSGGRVSDKGLLVLDTLGRAAGKGGSVALVTYAGEFSTSATPVPPTTSPLTATVRLGGSDGSAAGNGAALSRLIDAYGLAQGGSFSLQAPSIDIGSESRVGSIAFPAAFFDGNGFSAYSLSAVADHLAVAPGTNLVLRQRNFVADVSLANLASGAKLSQATDLDFLPDFLRQPVNLSLSATLSIIPPGPYDPATVLPASAIALSIGQGASIKAEAGANIAINVVGRDLYEGNTGSSTFNPPVAPQEAVGEVLGSITAPGGVIALTAGNRSRLWLGANSLLDVSGTALTDSRQLLYRAGKVLAGGKVSITANSSTAAVIGLKGALINVSGSTGQFDFLSDAPLVPQGQQRVAADVWSDAGSITMSAATLLYDGGFLATPGGAQAAGGSLTLFTPDNGSGDEVITVRQSGNAVPAGFKATDPLKPSDPLAADLTRSVIFFADRLNGSGIQTLTLSMGAVDDRGSPVTGDALGGSTKSLPGKLVFSGNVSLGGVSQIFLDASQIALVDPSQPAIAAGAPAAIPNFIAPTDPRACNVCIDAGYVTWRGAGSSVRFAPKAGKGVLLVSAGNIDIAAGGASGSFNSFVTISGAAKSSFVSAGDLRLRVPLANAPLDMPPGAYAAGGLLTAGDLTLKAAQIYPVSNVDFTLKSTALKGNIRFETNGAAATKPLSAGGQISVSAATIEQFGTLLAPLGTIRLGAQTLADLSPNDFSTALVPTQGVTFGAGSVTSISLAGTIVPYGQTANGTSWSYDSLSGRGLSAPPSKNLFVSGDAIEVAAGSTIDLGGGGDIQAIEFVPGTGGTRDVLKGAEVYAIIPGYNPAAAPIDFDFLLQQHDALPAAGAQIFLSGDSGLPAGSYTLLPAHYATLPGAFRVTAVRGGGDAIASLNKTLPDGTQRMAGYFANGLSATRDAVPQFFDVQSAQVWGKYSEIDKTLGNSFFAANAPAGSRLARDAGHAVFSAVTAMNLAGSVNFAPAASGRGGILDIVARDIQVLAPGTVARSGYIGLAANQLTGLGVESLLLGGVRSADGGAITVVSNSVEISNDASSPLQGPEIILVTGVGGGNNDPDFVDPNAGRRLTLDPGSVVRSIGQLADPSARTITIGSDANLIRGNGSLLAVSAGNGIRVDRQRVLSGTNGAISMFGASVTGNSLALDTSGRIVTAFDASGATAPDPRTAILGANIFISAQTINFGTARTGAGLNISDNIAAQLAQATNLTLRARQTIDFSGTSVNFAMGANSRLVLDGDTLNTRTAGNNVRLSAGSITLVNTGSGAPAPAVGTASLTLTATEITFGAGAQSLAGFGALAVSASSRISLRDSGSFDAAGANLSFTAPTLLSGTGSNQSITTTGDFTLAGTAPNNALVPGEQGGVFALTARSINLAANANIQAISGGVTLTSTSASAASANITMGANARIQAGGFVSTFFDVSKAVGGGQVQLFANQGSIDLDPTARIDVSSPAAAPGLAGQIVLSAANGSILSAGGAFDMAVIAGNLAGDGGGRLAINSQSLGATTISLPSLFDTSIDLRLAQGNIELGSDIRAASVTITADGGALTIGRIIDSSGTKGGTISLFGRDGVVLTPNARLLATASDADSHGGEILIGTRGTGILDLQGGLIDVSNTANAANGGTVRLRAPLIGAGLNDVAIRSSQNGAGNFAIQTEIRGASSIIVEAYRTFEACAVGGGCEFQGIVDPVAYASFFGSCKGTVCSGTLIDFVRNFSLSSATTGRLAGIAPGTLHLQPGIELVNSNTSINNGDITISKAWNLGAGFAGPLVAGDDFIKKGVVVIPKGTVVTDENGQLLAKYAAYDGRLVFVEGVSQIRQMVYRVGGSVTGEAPAVTLRAAGNVNVNATITDGFFNTRNTHDLTYQTAVADWFRRVGIGGSAAVSNSGGYLLAGASFASVAPFPAVPYDPAANAISPTGSAKDRAPISAADLFPLVADAKGSIVADDGKHYSAMQSSSYRIVAGANTASANPLALQARALFDASPGTALAGRGNVVIDKHTLYSRQDPLTGAADSFFTPTMIRTGTGSIDIAAGLDFVLADDKVPGVVYTAGRSSTELADPGFKLQTVDDPVFPGAKIVVPVATNPEGFLKPVILACTQAAGCNPYGPMNQAAYPVAGGHLTVKAQRDINGVQDIAAPTGGGDRVPSPQFYAPWLLAQGTALTTTDFGPFAPLSAYIATAGDSIFTPLQTSWWINFGTFDQGLMSVGGDVTVTAGRDIQQLSVSLPTTARVSGGLSSTVTDSKGNLVANIPVVHLNKSGDLTVIAGRDIKSGAYYEGSGTAKILAGGSVLASWNVLQDPTDTSSALLPVSTILAVDTGRISLVARGRIDLAGIVSGPSLQNIADTNSALDTAPLSLSVLAYGPRSAVDVLAISGDVIANSLALNTILIFNAYVPSQNSDYSGYPGTGLYPASFSAIAAGGDIEVQNSFRLAPSQDGVLNLLAHGSLITTNGLTSGIESQPLSTGPSLVERIFDPVGPLAGFAPAPGSASADLGSLLLHANDAVPDLFYAATGDIRATPDSSQGAPMAWEITKAARVQAARDIIDLSFFGQNLAPTDITAITAGRDLYYTGIWQKLLGIPHGVPDLGENQNLGGLSLAGPGFFQIQAGRNLGPFVTAQGNIAAAQFGLPTDPVGTGIVTFGNMVTVGNRRMFADQNPLGIDPFGAGANNSLPRQGADIVTLFGVGNGIDYADVIRSYVNPATATSPRDYLTPLGTYLQTLGFGALSAADAWAKFQTLPIGLQRIYADKVVFSEIKLVADTNGCCRGDNAIGYAAIGTLFPAQLPSGFAQSVLNQLPSDGSADPGDGYTDNSKLQADGLPVLRATGDLDLLHATIKTMQSAGKTLLGADGKPSVVAVGGDITVLGPGGNINVGTTAQEIRSNTVLNGNPVANRLSNSSLGVLTLNNGAINILTDVNVLVNQSRILTVQGGDILMWSSNGNLDAGRGAKTSVDFKPLSVLFDPADLQTINLNGLVSGAGIGTIRSTPDAPSASTALLAPRGIVNAGDAGLRSSGNLDIVALIVLNALNIASQGAVSGVPEVNAVNIGALESAASSGGQAARIAEDSVAATTNRGSPTVARAVPSLITVEVLGFGDCDPEGGKSCPAN